MKIGFMKDVRLAYARETFILDCRAAGLSPRILRTYREVLAAFIAYTGDITVQELKPDHVRLYIAHLAGRHEGKTRSPARHYAVIRTWIRWLYAQKVMNERISDQPPRRVKRFPLARRSSGITHAFLHPAGQGLYPGDDQHTGRSDWQRPRQHPM